MHRLWLLGVVAVAVAAIAGPGIAQAAGSGGVTGPAFYVDGQLYRTVNTPTDLSNTGAPDSSFDTIYQFFGLQPNVATAAPGDPGFNGGRWRVHGLQFADYDAAVAQFDANNSGDFDSAAEVQAALDGRAAVDTGVIKSFECPVIRVASSK
ncbi:MAG: hypothetical protein ACJ76R_03350 [Solirubrobacteraceae bacterium]